MDADDFGRPMAQGAFLGLILGLAAWLISWATNWWSWSLAHVFLATIGGALLALLLILGSMAWDYAWG